MDPCLSASSVLFLSTFSFSCFRNYHWQSCNNQFSRLSASFSGLSASTFFLLLFNIVLRFSAFEVLLYICFQSIFLLTHVDFPVLFDLPLYLYFLSVFSHPVVTLFKGFLFYLWLFPEFFLSL